MKSAFDIMSFTAINYLTIGVFLFFYCNRILIFVKKLLIMRFKEGDKVEVMNNKKVPVTWRMAEVVSHCGKTYHVRYDSYPGIVNDQMVEKVPRKFVRPCPPLMQGLENCAVGDFVEVLHENSWKIAAILKNMDEKEGNTRNMMKDRYLVRLLGSSCGLVVGRWNIRMRQTWHGSKWNLMGKVCVFFLYHGF